MTCDAGLSSMGGQLKSPQRWGRALDAILLGALCVILLRGHVSGVTTWVGNGDRLNSFLSVRLFEIDNIRQGIPPTWDELVFMGFGAAGLHYMAPGIDPIAYVEALFPREALLRVAGYTAGALLFLAAWASYMFVRETCESRAAGLAGAALYITSGFAIQRISQADSSFAVLIILPLAMLALRRVQTSNADWCFASLFGLFSALLLLTFLQEAAYACLLCAAYALYRSKARRQWRTVAVFAGAFGAALIAAAPRLYTVAAELRGVGRAATFHVTNGCEVLRWFSDGVFGRFPSEVLAIGNFVNLHEGFQLHTSTLGALAVIAVGTRYWGVGGSAAALVLCGVVANTFNKRILLGAGALVIAHVVLAVRGWVERAPRAEALKAGRWPEDVPFHLTVIATTFAIVLVEPVRYAVHVAFLSVDATHSRISMVGLLPVCTLVGAFVTWVLPAAAERPQRFGRRVVVVVSAVGLASVAVWLIERMSSADVASAVGMTVESVSARLYPGVSVLPGEVLKIIGSAFLFFGVLTARAVWRMRLEVNTCRDRYELRWNVPSKPESSTWRVVSSYGLALVIPFQGIATADFQVNGLQTHTFPVPFFSDNYLMVPGRALRPPDEESIRALHERLKPERYRTAFVLDQDFPAVTKPMEPAYPAHLAHFWRLRVVEGYGPGLSNRLGLLPWPEETGTLRTLSFPSQAHLPWHLLSALNVKFAIPVTAGIYYNIPDLAAAGTGFLAKSMVIHENPFGVVERHFFVPVVRRLNQEVTASTAMSDVFDGVMNVSWVEGFPADAHYSTVGEVSVSYAGPNILIRVTPADEKRFLVLNEAYDNGWRAWAGSKELKVWPTNIVMRGIEIPPRIAEVRLQFVPFMFSRTAIALYMLGALLAGAGWAVLRLTTHGRSAR